MENQPDHGMSIGEFEARKREISIELLQECRAFMEADIRIVQSFEQITRTIADHIARNPGSLDEDFDRGAFAGVASAVGGLSAAGDVTGAGIDWSKIGGLINAVKGILGDEKPFIQRIISRIIG